MTAGLPFQLAKSTATGTVGTPPARMVPQARTAVLSARIASWLSAVAGTEVAAGTCALPASPLVVAPDPPNVAVPPELFKPGAPDGGVPVTSRGTRVGMVAAV